MKSTILLRSAATVLGALALSTAATTPASAETTTLYVSPSGSDAAAGSAGAPLSTLGAALAKAVGGEKIVLAPGSYPSARDQKLRTTDVTIVGAGTAQTAVAGLEVLGGQHLRLSNIRFTAGVTVAGHPIKHAAQPATAVVFTSDEFTSAGTCVTIKEGSRDITVTGSWLHDCSTGIAGPGNPYVSTGIRITHDTIERVKSDGIQFGAWSDVEIADNAIRDIKDPAGVIHNDGVQLTGNSTDVRILRNVVQRSNTQLVFIQDAIGPIDQVDVEDNLLTNASAVALQSQGATNARFVNNTIWDAKDGGLWIRQGYLRDGTTVVPKDTVMVNNLATTIRVLDGVATPTTAGNVMLKPAYTTTIAAGVGTVTAPGFVDQAAGDYRLSATSLARPLGSALLLPPTDLTGASWTAPVPGAYA
jgi:Right handed beta helix region